MAKIAPKKEIRCANGHPVFRAIGEIDDAGPLRTVHVNTIHPLARFAPGIRVPTCPTCGTAVIDVNAQGMFLRSDTVKV